MTIVKIATIMVIGFVGYLFLSEIVEPFVIETLCRELVECWK